MEAPDELVEAFATAVPFALREMADVEAVALEARRATAGEAFGELSAVVRLTAPSGEGRLVLTFPYSTAAALARRVLAEVTTEPGDEMVRDCLGEIANVVAGQAKALLVGLPSHFTLSTPVVRGSDATEFGAGRWVIPFASEAGEFTVHLFPPS